MPKNKRVVKVGEARKIVRDATTFRIGTRKSGKSAHAMSTKQLQDVLSDTNKKRYWNNAQTVLNQRGAV